MGAIQNKQTNRNPFDVPRGLGSAMILKTFTRSMPLSVLIIMAANHVQMSEASNARCLHVSVLYMVST